MSPYTMIAGEDLAAYRECPRCFWLRHRQRDVPPIADASSVFEKVAHEGVLEYFDRYRGRVPAYFLGELDGKLIDDDDLVAAWRNPRKGLTTLNQYGEVTLRGWMDDCFMDGEDYIPAFVAFVTRERGKDEWQENQMLYDAIVYLLNANKRPTADYVYQFSFVPDPMLKMQIGLSAKVVRIDVDPMRAERLFHEAANLLHEKELPPAGAYCRVCSWFATRAKHV